MAGKAMNALQVDAHALQLIDKYIYRGGRLARKRTAAAVILPLSRAPLVSAVNFYTWLLTLKSWSYVIFS